MWRWALAGTAILIIAVGGTAFYLSDKLYLRFPHTAIAPSQFARLYEPQQLKADFQYLTAKIEHVHPNIRAVVDPNDYAARKTQILAALNRPMTRVQFYDVVSAINGEWHDGHTEIVVPREEWQHYRAVGALPPFGVSIDDKGLSIAQSFGDVKIPLGSRLNSLNGVGGPELAAWLIARESAETTTGKRAYAAGHFPSHVWAYGLRAPFTIDYQPPDGSPVVRVESKGVDWDTWNRRSGFDSSAPMKLGFSDDIATLYLRDFDEPADRYSVFLKDAFQRIKTQNPRALVIDLRKNNGGDSREADELQTYLSDSQLPALEKVAIKTTPEVKAIYRTLLPEGFRWIPLNDVVPMLHGIDTAPDNGVFTFQPEAAAPTLRSSSNPLAYQGKLYVLISPYTYSTAVLFVAPLKYWHRAILIGETTGEPMTFFGDNYEFDLPNTKLVADVSHKTFYLLGSKGFGVGVEPNIAVTPNEPDAMALALKEIARRDSVRATVAKP
ncbi:MAG: S41 family peptidase [Rhizomicrobium sp.]